MMEWEPVKLLKSVIYVTLATVIVMWVCAFFFPKFK